MSSPLLKILLEKDRKPAEDVEKLIEKLNKSLQAELENVTVAKALSPVVLLDSKRLEEMINCYKETMSGLVEKLEETVDADKTEQINEIKAIIKEQDGVFTQILAFLERIQPFLEKLGVNAGLEHEALTKLNTLLDKYSR